MDQSSSVLYSGLDHIKLSGAVGPTRCRNDQPVRKVQILPSSLIKRNAVTKKDEIVDV